VIDDFEDDVAGNYAFPRWATLITKPAAVPAATAAPVAASFSASKQSKYPWLRLTPLA